MKWWISWCNFKAKTYSFVGFDAVFGTFFWGGSSTNLWIVGISCQGVFLSVGFDQPWTVEALKWWTHHAESLRHDRTNMRRWYFFWACLKLQPNKEKDILYTHATKGGSKMYAPVCRQATFRAWGFIGTIIFFGDFHLGSPCWWTLRPVSGHS